MPERSHTTDADVGVFLAGGLRDRMVHESVLRAIEADMASRGWFNTGRWHDPITVIDEYPDDADEVAINTISISMGDADGYRVEMGSQMESHEQTLFVDIYAESDALGRHIVGDIYEYLKKVKRIQVFDYRQTPPTAEFWAHVEDDDIIKRRGRTVTQAWKKHWYVIAFTVTDGRTNA